MMNENLKHSLIKKLVNNTISSEEYRQLELAAMDDPFLFDALEGYHYTKEKNHQANINRVRTKINIQGDVNRSKSFWFLAYAASFISICALGYFLFNPTEKTNILYSESEEKNETLKINLDIAKIENHHDIVILNTKKENKKIYPSESKNIRATTLEKSSEEIKEEVVMDSKIDTEELLNSPKIASKDFVDIQKSNPIMPINIQAPFKVIEGRITDKAGEPIIGASVYSKDFGTITDLEGNFKINLDTSAKNLNIAYVGMESKVIPIEPNKKVYQETLEEGPLLDEIVVTGMGKARTKGSGVKDWDVFNEKIKQLLVSKSSGENIDEIYIVLEISPKGKINSCKIMTKVNKQTAMKLEKEIKKLSKYIPQFDYGKQVDRTIKL